MNRERRREVGRVFFDLSKYLSSDGIVWEKDPANPVVTGGLSADWDPSVADPSVIRMGGSYEMWFAGFSTGGTHKIGFAYSCGR